MAKATPEQTKKARRAAGVVALVVAAFAAAFIGLVLFLDALASERQQEEVEIAQQEEQAPTDPFYVLLIGSDTRKGTAVYTGKPTEHAQVDQHSDVMTLMRVDPQTYTVSLLSIPRDTVIYDDGEKINSALMGNDPDQVVQAVEELTGLGADYYMLTTFGTFADLIDAIGGVYVDVPRAVEASDPISGGMIRLKAGEGQHLDGAQALALARARAEYVYDQDAIRQSNVRAIEAAIIERMLSGEGVSMQALVVLLKNDVRTNMDLSVLGLAIKDFMDHPGEVTILSGTGPYEGGPCGEDGLWVVPNDQAAWKKIMKLFKAGKDFSQVVAEPELAPIEEETPSASSSSAAASGKAASSSSASASSASSDPSDSSSSAASAKPSSGSSSKSAVK